MNILMISFSGTVTEEYYLSELGNFLAGTDSVTVMVPGYTGTGKFRAGVNIASFPFPRNLFLAILDSFNLFLYINLLKKINRIAPDVIHIAMELRFPFFLAWLLHGRYPLVTTVHEPRPLKSDPGIIRRFLLNPVQTFSLKLLAGFSAKVIVHGKNHREHLLEMKVPEDKIEVISHPGYSFFSGAPQKEAGKKQNHVLFFGRISSYKGIEYLIQAAKTVKERVQDLVVTIAGEGDFSRYGKLINGDGTFRIINRFISDTEVPLLFQQASLVVLPYIDGSQSGIVTIAYGYGKPVIATNVGNLPEMVENRRTGLTVPPRDAAALADSILELLENRELAEEMGRNGYALMKNRMSQDRICAETLKVYRQAALKTRENKDKP
jgi:alpha-maltose-1-phosphate synthase